MNAFSPLGNSGDLHAPEVGKADAFLNPKRSGYRAYHDFVSMLQNSIDTSCMVLAKIADVELSAQGACNLAPLFRVTVGTDSCKPAILLTGSIHGNEEAGMYALVRFLEHDATSYLDKFRFVIYPCLNPSGYELHSRWNAKRQDINRSFTDELPSAEAAAVVQDLNSAMMPSHYEITIDLHETPPDDAVSMAAQGEEGFENTPIGFYLYEDCPDHSRRIGVPIVNEVAKLTAICKDPMIFREPSVDGVIWYPEANSNPSFVQGRTLDAYLRRNGFTQQALVTETYADSDLEHRVQIQLAVIHSALRAV